MPSFKLQVVRANGTPAADALLSVAGAPVPVPDLGYVADAAGRVSIDGPAGNYTFSIWLDGSERLVQYELSPQSGVHLIRLPV
ncbi:hypothetical protein ACSFA8_23030 [Variovorax sp. RT4R15]|uniref:hypothetical protein n=1 Tax=Variovorax sp. RT4R15 TaxID=3443737 RepID=UPI003F44F64A